MLIKHRKDKTNIFLLQEKNSWINMLYCNSLKQFNNIKR